MNRGIWLSRNEPPLFIGTNRSTVSVFNELLLHGSVRTKYPNGARYAQGNSLQMVK